ncbi:RHS repeat-associated core domain-containing protein [Flavobacterium hauense]
MKSIYTFFISLCFTIALAQDRIPTFYPVMVKCVGDPVSPLPTTSLEGITGIWSPEIYSYGEFVYTFTPNPGQNAKDAYMQILIPELLLPSFNEVPTICAGDYLYELPTVSKENITGFWEPALNNLETTTYTFTPYPGQCASQSTLTISVNPALIPSFSEIYSVSICSGTYLNPLPTTSLEGVEGSWSPPLDKYATTTYTFTPNPGQCADNVQVTIVVNSPITPSFEDIFPICSENDINVLPSVSLEGIYGSWSPEFDSKNSTLYTFLADEGQCAGTTTLRLDVITSDIPTFEEVQPVCSGEYLSELPTVSLEGISGSWSPELDNTATTTYTFTPDAGLCTSNATLTIVIDPNIPHFDEILPICSGDNLSELTTSSQEGITGSWFPPNVDTKLTTTYTFTPDEDQCASPAFLTIVVNQYEADFKNLAICSGTPIEELPSQSPNGVSGYWRELDESSYIFYPDENQCAQNNVVVKVISPIKPEFIEVSPIEVGAMTDDLLPNISLNGIAGEWSPELNNTETTTYTFTPSPGQCAEAIQMKILVASARFNSPLDYSEEQSEGLANVVSLITSATGNSGEVGITSGEVSVSPSGAGLYNIPINVPPGIKGVAPQISLSYNSQSGMGIAGYGWNLGGLSAITRIPSTKFHDDIIDPVDFDDYDRFALDGQRLILKTGVYGGANSTYETEQFSNIRITYTGSHFKVEYPDGAVAYYGQTADSKAAITYHITYWENLQSLRVTYNYTKSVNLSYINTIKYGSRGTTTPINEIKFNYTNRVREEQYYIAGVDFKDNKILESINIKGNNVPYKNYVLSYDQALKYHRLKKVTEKNGNSSKSYNPTTFEYENENFSINTVRSTTPNFIDNVPFQNSYEYFTSGFWFLDPGGLRFKPKDVINGDFDGDGDQDFIYKKKLYRKIDDSGAQPIVVDFAGLIDYDIFSQFPIRTLSKKSVGTYQVLNRDTWCFEKIKEIGSDTTTLEFLIYGKNENDDSVTKLYSKEVTVKGSTPEELTGDFNGDGFTDRLLLKHNTASSRELYFVNLDPRISVDYIKNLGVIHNVSPKFNLEKESHIYIADMNADGKSDIVVFQGTTNKIVIYSLGDNDNLITLWETPINYLTPNNKIFYEQILVRRIYEETHSFMYNIYDKYYYDPIFADLNGDGNTDIVLRGLERKVLISTGVGLKSEALPNTFPPSKESNIFIPTDFDNDGKTNIVAFRKIGNSKWTVNNLSRTYNGTWTSYWDTFTNSDPSHCSSTITDMLPFMVKTSKVYTDHPQILGMECQYKDGCYRNFKIGFYTNMNSCSTNKSLQKITSGNGMRDYLYYDQLVPGGVCYKPAGQIESYPNYDIGGSSTLRAVEHISKEVTPGSFKHQFFRYMGATANSEGLGFLGFRSLIKTNWFSDVTKVISTITVNDMSLRGNPVMSFSINGLASPDKVLLPGDPYISKTLYTYNNNLAQNPLQSNKVFKLRNTFTQIFNGLEGTINDITSTYDEYNLKSTKTVLRGNDSPVNKTIEEVYSYDNLISSPYLIGRPKSKFVTSKLGSDTSVNEEVYTFENDLLKETKQRSTNSGVATIYLTEKNSYDVYGNIINKTISAPNLTDRISLFEYDAQTHRFLTKTTDMVGLETVFTYNLSTGQLLSEISPSATGFPKKNIYSYDTWGKLTNTTNYLGNTTVLSSTITYKNISEGVQQSVWANDGSESKVILDYSGRKLHELNKNINNKWSCISTQYDFNNQPLKISLPYFIEGNNYGNFKVWNEFQYDRYGRVIQSNNLKTSSSNGKQTLYSYTGLSVMENDGQKQKTTLKNNYGSISQISESGGETINYKYFANGSLKSTETGGAETLIEQDGFGRRKTLIDPSAGTYRYMYTNFGDLVSEEIEDKGITEYVLDNYGRITEKKIKGYGNDITDSKIQYGYNNYNLVNSVLLIDEANDYRISYSYEYDNFLRLKKTREARTSSVNSKKFFDFQREYLYDGFSRADREKYYAKDVRTGKLLEKWIKTYYKNGSKHQLFDMLNSTTVGNTKLWQTNLTEPGGRVTTATLGNNVEILNAIGNNGIPILTVHSKGANNVIFLHTIFSATTGNLSSRKYMLGNTNWNENLSYDSFDRLTEFKNNAGYQSQLYNANGTISKNNAGAYEYHAQGKPYTQTALSGSDPATLNFYRNNRQDIDYNVFNSPVSISQNETERINFEYNAFNQRAVMYYGNLEENKNDRIMRKFYSSDGSMEVRRRTVSGSNTNEFTFYIGGDGYTAPVVFRGDGSNKAYYYLHRDYQGSILAITNSTGNVIEQRLFDVWGNVIGYKGTSTTIPTSSTSLFLDRGYTGHEHLLGVDLINMNGRIYDPKLHRFLQPDDNIQDPTNPQNFNRFGYCLNNPTKYSDPTGEWWDIALGFVFSAYVHGAQATGQANPLKWNAGQIINAVGAPASQVLSLGATNFANAYVDNYNKESLLSGTVGSIPVDYSFIKVDYSWSQLKSDYLRMGRRADSWAEGEGGQAFGQFVAGMNPIISGYNAYLGVTEGKDMYGNEMDNGDTALTIASLIPYGKFTKYLKFGSFTDDALKMGNDFAEAIKFSTSSKSLKYARNYTIYNSKGELYKFGVSGADLVRYNRSLKQAGPGAYGKYSDAIYKYQAHINEKYLRSLHYNSTGQYTIPGMKIPYPIDFATGRPIKP